MLSVGGRGVCGMDGVSVRTVSPEYRTTTLS